MTKEELAAVMKKIMGHRNIVPGPGWIPSQARSLALRVLDDRLRQT